MTPPTTLQAAKEFKRRLREVLAVALERFEQETGVTPSAIRIEMLDVTSHGDTVRRRVLGDVAIEIEL